jgi:arginyl-tRNA--protein-N-Asp/Glu arginylyltransferase
LKNKKSFYIICKECGGKFARNGSNVYKNQQNYCKACHKARMQERNRGNKSHHRAVKKYMAKNKEKYQAYWKEYYQQERDTLHDNYILQLLRHRSGADKSKYIKGDIGKLKNIVDKQRQKLKLEREIKNIL